MRQLIVKQTGYLPFVQVTYKKILNKSNAILAACLHLLATFGLECRAFACKKKWGVGGGGAPPALPRPPPMYCKGRVCSFP